jgi:hypothetical protein
VRERKIPVADFSRPVRLGTDSVVITRNSTLVRLDPSGKALYSVPLDPTARFNSAEPSRDASRLYVLSNRTLTALDATTGEQAAQLPLPEGAAMPRVTPLQDGRVILTAGGKLMTLGADLQSLGTRDLGYEPTSVCPLSDGTLVLHEAMRGRKMQVIDRSGQVILDRGGDNATVSPRVTPEGKVWWREERDSTRPPGSPRYAIGRFDPASGETRTFEVGASVRDLYPRKDGSFLIHEEDMVVAPRFVLYDADGREVRRFKPTHEGGLEQLMLSPDARSAYVLYDVYRGLDSKERRAAIDRIDLEARGVLDQGLGYLASMTGLSSKAERIYEGERDPRRFFPLVLDDGSLLVFHEKTVDRLDGEGRLLQQYPDSSSITGLRPRPANDVLGGRNAETVDQHLADWQHDYLYVDLNQHRPWGSPLPTGDGCVTFRQPIGDLEAGREIAPPRADQTEAEMRAKLFAPRRRSDDHELEFPGGGRVCYGGENLTIEIPHPGGRADEFDRISYSFDGVRTFTGALAVKAGDRRVVVAAASDGRVYWLDGSTNSLDRECPRFDAGVPIEHLSAEGGKVYGYGGDGTVIILDPPDGLAIEEPPAPRSSEASKDGRVIVSEREVRIGGIAIPRREG